MEKKTCEDVEESSKSLDEITNEELSPAELEELGLYLEAMISLEMNVIETSPNDVRNLSDDDLIDILENSDPSQLILFDVIEGHEFDLTCLNQSF